MLRSVFLRHPQIETVTVFGSRAKGTHSDRSDVDLAVTDAIEPLQAEAIASELDELTLPHRFEMQSLAHVHHQPLLDQIRRVGIQIYPTS
jgi:predicted nucleotidyltransferase